jgi:hypothetical protein
VESPKKTKNKIIKQKCNQKGYLYNPIMYLQAGGGGRFTSPPLPVHVPFVYPSGGMKSTRILEKTHVISRAETRDRDRDGIDGEKERKRGRISITT